MRNSGEKSGAGVPIRKSRLPLGACLALSLLAGRPADRVLPDRVLRPGTPRVVEPRAPAGYDWLQFDRDPAHSGNNPLETRISRGNVASLKRLFRAPLLTVADNSPVYLSRVATAIGTRDLVFAATTPGFVVAHDACTGSRVWFHAPPPGLTWTTASPAIDSNRNFLYTYELDGFAHRLRVEDGTEVTGGGWPQLITRKPDVEKASGSLSIVTTNGGKRFLYVSTAGFPGAGAAGDAGDYQGHVTAIDLDSGAQRVFNTLCSDRPIHFGFQLPEDCTHVRAGAWGRAGVTYDSVAERVLFATGNGDFDADRQGFNWGNSLLSLPPDLASPTGLPADSYTPTEYQSLEDGDLDLTSVLILPSAGSSTSRRLAVQTGKDGQLRLLDLSDLSGRGGPGHVGGELQVLPVPQGGGVLTAPASWPNPADQTVWVFVANRHGLSGLRVSSETGGTGRRRASASPPALSVQWTQGRGGTSPIVANGILYYAGTGFVAALDPTTGQELWSDHDLGELHWQSPILVNGVLYVTDDVPTLSAYAPGGVAPPRPDGPCR
jgi:outer membrane protein assembly factor BamB